MDLAGKNPELAHYLKTTLGAAYPSFLAAPAEQPAVRVNTLKYQPGRFRTFLKRRAVPFHTIPFNKNGYVLEDDYLPLSHSLAFFEGWFQYQGIASQLPAVLLDPKSGDKVLDIAAAPGSKSAQMADMMQDQGELVLNDYSRDRLQALNANMQRSGARNYYVLNIRGERLGRIAKDYFDKILIDAPCTALGTFAANQEVASWWSKTKLDKLTRIQYHLLVSAFKCLKKGGEMVYSTCSVGPEENELVVNELLRKYPTSVVEPQPALRKQFDPGFTTFRAQKLDPGLTRALRIWPHKHQLEGFFAVKLRKEDEYKETEGEKKYPEVVLLNADDSRIEPVLHQISQQWGIPDALWRDFKYHLTKTRIWMVAGCIDKIIVNPFVSAGMLLGEKRLYGWKLVNASVQRLGKLIKQRVVALSAGQMTELFAKSSIAVTDIPNGYYAVAYDNRPLASAYVEDNKMRIRLPHSFRLII